MQRLHCHQILLVCINSYTIAVPWAYDVLAHSHFFSGKKCKLLEDPTDWVKLVASHPFCSVEAFQDFHRVKYSQVAIIPQKKWSSIRGLLQWIPKSSTKYDVLIRKPRTFERQVVEGLIRVTSAFHAQLHGCEGSKAPVEPKKWICVYIYIYICIYIYSENQQKPLPVQDHMFQHPCASAAKGIGSR